MLRKIVFFLIFCVKTSLFAQNIMPTWEGDIVLPYQFGTIPIGAATYMMDYRGEYMKSFIPLEDLQNPYFGVFRNRFFELIAEKKLTCFYDADLTKVLKKPLDEHFSFENYGDYSCSFGWSEEDYIRHAEGILAAKKAIPFGYGYTVNTFFIKQHLKYFAETQRIESRIVAIAPTIILKIKQSSIYEFDDFKPIFWVKNPDFQHSLAIENGENTCVMYAGHRNILDTTVVNGVKTGENLAILKKIIIQNLKNKPKERLLSPFLPLKNRQIRYTLSQKGIDSVYMPPPDTAIVYDAQYNESIKITQKPRLDLDTSTTNSGLHQIFIFDTKTGALVTSTGEIGVEHAILDDKGNFRYSQTLFFYPIHSENIDKKQRKRQ